MSVRHCNTYIELQKTSFIFPDLLLLSSIVFQWTQSHTSKRCVYCLCYWQKPTTAGWQYLTFLETGICQSRLLGHLMKYLPAK